MIGPDTLNSDMRKRNNLPPKHPSRVKVTIKRFHMFGVVFCFELGGKKQLFGVSPKF